MIILRWFLSKKVRHAVDACRHVSKLVNAQRDLLTDTAIERVEGAVETVRSELRQGGGPDKLEAALQALEKAVQKNLRPYPHPSWRENIEVFLVTGAVVLALRTFFIQPMAIPTGSAQPTLWGIVQTSLRNDPEAHVPSGLTRFVEKWWSGVSYIRIVAKEDGTLRMASKPRLVFPFVKMQTLTVGNRTYRTFFPSSFDRLESLCAGARDPLQSNTFYRKGDDIVNLRVVAGDHLFVNRLIYNFRPPHRGEIVVFSSEGMTGLIENTHYIKRLVGLPDEKVQILDNRHVVITNDQGRQELDASTPGFENVYGFNPSEPPRQDRYSGHVNNVIGAKYGRPNIAPNFPNENAVYTVPSKHYLPFGDNTMNSQDGRFWGCFPEERLVGRASFVFWPISDRFGWGYR